MAVALSYDIGYMGYAKIETIPIMATSGNITVQHSPIYTSGVWGAEWENSAQQVAFAPDFPIASASIGFQLIKNGLFKELGSFITDRDKSKKITILPNGIAGYKGDMYFEQLSYTASQDSLITGDLSCKGTNLKEVIKQHRSDLDDGKNDLTFFNENDRYKNVYPSYSSNIIFPSHKIGLKNIKTVNRQVWEKKLLNWSLQVSSEVVFVKTCNCFNKDLKQLTADYFAIGQLKSSGSIQHLGINQRAMHQNTFFYINKPTYIYLRSCNGNDIQKIIIPNMECTNFSSGLQSGASLIQSSFNFTVIGDGDGSLIKFS